VRWPTAVLLSAGALVAVAPAILSGCGDEEKVTIETRGDGLEKADESIEKAGQKTGEALEKAGEKTGEALQEAGEKTEEALDKADKKVDVEVKD